MENSQNRHWFRAKRYGIGWVPATWEGWMVTLLYTVLVTASAVLFTTIAAASPDSFGSSLASDLLLARFCLWIFAVTLLFLWICYKTGDAPLWHFGNKK